MVSHLSCRSSTPKSVLSFSNVWNSFFVPRAQAVWSYSEMQTDTPGSNSAGSYLCLNSLAWCGQYNVLKLFLCPHLSKSEFLICACMCIHMDSFGSLKPIDLFSSLCFQMHEIHRIMKKTNYSELHLSKTFFKVVLHVLLNWLIKLDLPV